MRKGGNTQNLTPFKKGESGNPNGRPRKLPELDKLLAEVLGEDPSDPDAKSEAKEVLKRLIKSAKEGNVQAQIAVLDRAYGKPKQSTELTGANGGPIDISFDVNKLSTDEAAALLDLIEKAKE